MDIRRIRKVLAQERCTNMSVRNEYAETTTWICCYVFIHSK
jgi:hypothetical protein